MSYTANYKVETTVKSFQIVEYLARNGVTGISQLSDDLDISKSIVHNHLSTLREMGYVIKVDRRYRLSLRFLELGIQVRDMSGLFYQLKRSAAAVSNQFDTVIYLLEREEKTGIVTQIWGESNPETTVLEVGDRLELTDSVLGIALLGALSESERDAVLREAESEADDVQDLLSIAVDQRIVTGKLDGSSAATALAAGLVDMDDTSQGALGIQVPADADPETAKAVETALVSLTTDLQADRQRDGETRSFATMKHSWFSE